MLAATALFVVEIGASIGPCGIEIYVKMSHRPDPKQLQSDRVELK